MEPINENTQTDISEEEVTTNETITENESAEASTPEGVTADDLLLKDASMLKAHITNLENSVYEHKEILKAHKKFHVITLILIIILILMSFFSLLVTLGIGKNFRCNESSQIEPTPDPFSGYWNEYDNMVKKPNIYIYPEETSNVDVYLNVDSIGTTWPRANMVDENEYHWNVTADPDGTLHQDSYEYSYLFWEGENTISPSFERGFCVSGQETGEFLRIVLNEMGLTPEEYNEFIVFWLPQMEKNPYNLITFMGIDTTDEYNTTYPLYVVDENGNTPDCMMRVCMLWKPVEKPVEIEPQVFTTLRRHGFTVIEWGGAEVKE